MAATATILPSPDFSNDPGHYVAGLRPMRDVGYRLEKVSWHGKTVIHNYGHGGAGITLSWGCAAEVLDLVVASGAPRTTEVAVVGAGVMGLTAATLLLERGYRPTIYAEARSPDTTSNVAGGQWAPSFVTPPSGHAGHAQFERIMRNAFRAHESRIGQGYGVVRRDNYTLQPSSTFEKVPLDLIPAPDELDSLPFERLNRPGYRYRTLLIEPPIFLPRLTQDLEKNGATFRVPHRFASAAEVAALPQSIIINCTGLGARQLWGDHEVYPLRGQLALLPPQPELEYLFSKTGYLFPRTDSVVVGGTQEKTSDPRPDPRKCRELVATMKAIFDGQVRALSKYPSWFITDK